MMTKLEKRVSNYEYALGVKRAVREARHRRKTAAAYARAAEVQVAIETGVKRLLATEPVPSILVIWYIVYARSLGPVIRKHPDSEQLKIAVGLLTAKWQQRGLDERIMKRIRAELFDLPD